MPITVSRASLQHVTDVARLFDLYRQFYKCEPNMELATQFIHERIDNSESTIFIAQNDEAVVGFVQLYPTFCSVDAVKRYILYDLYVDASSRNAGVGAKLMNKASEYAKENGASRLDLETEHSNKAGQHLYEKLGYKRVSEEFYTYSLEV